jgi:outer membrane lipoprotein LolB
VSVRRRAPATLVCAFALAACSSLPPAPPAGEVMSGRLSVRVASDPPRSGTAAFELRGSPEAGQLDLSTPLGSLMARARWSPGEVVLATPKEEKSYADLDALTRDVLGESLPVPALFDWLLGRPWPGAPSQPRSDPPGFEQLGWAVSLAQFDRGTIEAQRRQDPPVTVRARLDR